MSCVKALARVAIVDLNAGAPNRSVPALSAAIGAAGGTAAHFDPRVAGSMPPTDMDAYVITGGPGSPLACARWRTEILSSIPAWTAQDIPVFGICLGFQLLAQAHGWPVRRLEDRRRGLHPVTRTDAGLHDPLLATLPSDAICFEQRGWSVTGRDADRVLAGTAEDATAIRFSPDVAGVAFHPEAEPALVARWLGLAGDEREALTRRMLPVFDTVGACVARMIADTGVPSPRFTTRC